MENIGDAAYTALMIYVGLSIQQRLDNCFAPPLRGYGYVQPRAKCCLPRASIVFIDQLAELFDIIPVN